PSSATALVAGALLAFALSCDEIIVTNFTAGAETTLPIFILNNIRLPRNLPIVNVAAMVVIVLSLIPVYLAQRLIREPVGREKAEAPSEGPAEAGPVAGVTAVAAQVGWRSSSPIGPGRSSSD